MQNAEHLRSIVFCACVGALVRPVCFPSVVASFWCVVRGALCFCRVAFPLVMLSRLNFSPVLAFRVFVGVIGGVRGFRALCGKI